MEKVLGQVTMRVVQGDITIEVVDVIVNAANSSLLGGSGVDGAIHRAAGPSLLEECRQLRARQGGCDTGDAVITGAGELAASWIVHTVGPVWSAERAQECDALLAQCYTRSLDLAQQAGASSIAFPSISTGVYCFPKGRAAQVAFAAVVDSSSALDEITFVCFDSETSDLYEKLLASV